MYSKVKTLCWCIMLSYSLPCLAQEDYGNINILSSESIQQYGYINISGTIKDAITGNPLHLSPVEILKNGVHLASINTSNDGVYSWKSETPPGRYDLRFRKTEYETILIKNARLNDGDNSLNIMLTPLFNDFDTLTVFDYLMPKCFTYLFGRATDNRIHRYNQHINNNPYSPRVLAFLDPVEKRYTNIPILDFKIEEKSLYESLEGCSIIYGKLSTLNNLSNILTVELYWNETPIACDLIELDGSFQFFNLHGGKYALKIEGINLDSLWIKNISLSISEHAFIDVQITE